MRHIQEKFEELLEKHGLKKTPSRLSVLNILSSREVATSELYLEQKLGDKVNRVTLYRILKTFEGKGIIHKVLDQNGTANYAVCSPQCNEWHHHDEHLHFNCVVCNKVYCLDNIEFPDVKIPRGFKLESVNYTASGICKQCRKSADTKN